MEWYRNIKRYLSGDDVLYAKQRLVELGYLYAATKKRFGDDSYKATKAFQAANGLPVDGVIGRETWAALFSEPKPVPPIPYDIAEPARSEIALALAQTTAKRREICELALSYCVDRNTDPSTLKGFYIRGANLFDKDLTLHVMTEARLNSYFRKSAYEPYFDEGRKEMMLRNAQLSGFTIPGADCSGFIVGLWRKVGVVSAGFDSNANHLYSSYCVDRSASDILPGDLAHKNGHIGLVVAPNWIVESAGGAYGVQLTKRTDRRVIDFRTRKIVKLSKWQNFGDPKTY